MIGRAFDRDRGRTKIRIIRNFSLLLIRPSIAITINKQAKKRMVCLEPRSGMKSRAGRKVPIMLPIVPMEKTLPEVLPIFLLFLVTSLIIYGLVKASKVMGIIKSRIMVRNEAIRIVHDELWEVNGLSKTWEASGLTRKGTIKSKIPEQRII